MGRQSGTLRDESKKKCHQKWNTHCTANMLCSHIWHRYLKDAGDVCAPFDQTASDHVVKVSPTNVTIVSLVSLTHAMVEPKVTDWRDHLPQ